MVWYARLCGVLAVIYLIAFAAQSPGTVAGATKPPAMMRAVTGEVLPVSEAMKVNYLVSYTARYPDFPAVLNKSRWVDALKGEKSCTSNPRKVWTFSGGGDFGRVCHMVPSESGRLYECEEQGRMGRKSTHIYMVRFGDSILPDWALDRPHITLEREGRPHKVITLEVCLR